MPDDVFAARASPGAWADDVVHGLGQKYCALVIIPQPLDRPASARLQSMLAELAALVLARVPVTNLLLEGGATASAVCRRMGWNDFPVAGELAPGVVQLHAGGQSVIIKPGSYPWPEMVWE
jgi:uncharacterized protein YgbK (DUF1537 family)